MCVIADMVRLYLAFLEAFGSVAILEVFPVLTLTVRGKIIT